MSDRNSFYGNSNSSSSDIDLATIGDKYLTAKEPESTRDPVPDGKYQVNVEKAELTRSKNTGSPMLRMTFKILGPTNPGRLLWHYNMFTTEDNLGWLKKDLRTCGMVLDSLPELKDRLHELVDIKLEVTKKTKNDMENLWINKRIYFNDGELGPTRSAPTGDVPF
jgi:hypothetical protein